MYSVAVEVRTSLELDINNTRKNVLKKYKHFSDLSAECSIVQVCSVYTWQQRNLCALFYIRILTYSVGIMAFRESVMNSFHMEYYIYIWNFYNYNILEKENK